jgi:hypothetical protein
LTGGERSTNEALANIPVVGVRFLCGLRVASTLAALFRSIVDCWDTVVLGRDVSDVFVAKKSLQELNLKF